MRKIEKKYQLIFNKNHTKKLKKDHLKLKDIFEIQKNNYTKKNQLKKVKFRRFLFV